MGWFKKTDENDPGEEAPEMSPRPLAPPPPAAPPTPAAAPEADPSTRASLASLLSGRPPSAAQQQPEALPTDDSASVFLESVDIEGSLEGQGDVVLRGRVRGSINISGSLVVTQTGSVQADVCAREVINAGTVEGNIAASEKVRVQATGLVKGDIDSPSIVIDDGGGVEGFVQMEPPGGEEFVEDDDLPPRADAKPAAPPSMRFASRMPAPAGLAAPRPGVAGGFQASPVVADTGNGNGRSALQAREAPVPFLAPRATPAAGDAASVFFADDAEVNAPSKTAPEAGQGGGSDDPFADPPPPPSRPLPEL